MKKISVCLMIFSLASCMQASFSYTNATSESVEITYTYQRIASTQIEDYCRLTTVETYTVETVSENNPGYQDPPPQTNYYYWLDSNYEISGEDSGEVTVSEWVGPGETVTFDDTYTNNGSPQTTSSTQSWTDSEDQYTTQSSPWYESVHHHWDWNYQLETRQTITLLGESTTYRLLSAP